MANPGDLRLAPDGYLLWSWKRKTLHVKYGRSASATPIPASAGCLMRSVTITTYCCSRRAVSTVSTLEMRRFDFLFHGEMVGLSMISHCATRRSSRGNGFMSELMMSALEAARRRGDMIAALVPTHDWLSFLFGRWGFSTVFITTYSALRRYTHSATGTVIIRSIIRHRMKSTWLSVKWRCSGRAH